MRKTVFEGLCPGKSQTVLLSYRSKLEFFNFRYSIYRLYNMRKPAFAICANQPVQSDQSLCFRCLDSVIPIFAIVEISRPELISSAEQAGLSLTWSEIPKTGFLMTRLISRQRTTKMLIRLEMRRIICVLIVCIWHKQVFSWQIVMTPT